MRVPVLILPLLLLAGCGIAAYRPQDMSAHAVVLQTPVVEQDDLYDCGLAAISALCGYYGIEIPPDQRTELAQLATKNEGLSGTELREALERDGMEVYLFEGHVKEGATSLQANLLAHRPMLVMIDLGGSHHYSLVVGFDPDADSLVLLDPLLSLIVMDAASFEARWAPTRHFAMLAVPRKGDWHGTR
jgi:ABC-type bacteriocin/lantibiotic exporter with double-glycine peptidase domain